MCKIYTLRDKNEKPGQKMLSKYNVINCFNERIY